MSIIDREGDRISVVLLDMTMPVLGGEEVFRHIQRVKPTMRVALLVGKGLAGFLRKPWDPADLFAALEKALT